MKKIVALTLVTAAMALAGCDMPDKLEKPNPVAEWTWTGNPKLDNGGTISLNLGGYGNFNARSTPPGEEARSVEGRWTVGESWNEKACGDRISLSDEDRLTRTADGKVENHRVSRASIGLLYWVAKGAELPSGAKIVSKQNMTDSGASNPFDASLRTVVANNLLPHSIPPLPDHAKGEFWLVEENAELVRTGRAAVASGSLVQYPFALLAECFGSPDKDAKVRLMFRSRNLTAAAS